VEYRRQDVQMGEIRDREYLRFVVEEEERTRPFAGMQRMVEERSGRRASLKGPTA